MGDEPGTSGESSEPGLARKLRDIAAVIVALGVLAGAVLTVTKQFTDDGDGSETISGGSVVVREPRIQGSSAVFDTDVTVTGEKGREVRVLWTLFDAELGHPVDEPGFVKQPVATFEPAADTVERSFEAVVPAPQTTDFVFLRVELYDDADQRLAIGDSERLRLGGFSP